MKKFLLSSFIVIFSIRQTYGMQAPTASIGTKFFKNGMVGLHWSALLGSSVYINNLLFKNFKTTKDSIIPADDESKKFVQQTLSEYGFVPELITNLNVSNIETHNAFAYFDNSLIVPFDKNRLAVAKRLNNKQTKAIDYLWDYWNDLTHNSRKKKFTYDGASDEAQILAMYQTGYGLPMDTVKPLLAAHGNYIGENTLPLWKGALAHEAGHAMQPDLLISQPLAMIAGMLVIRGGIFASAKLLNKLFIKNDFYKKFAVSSDKKNVIIGFGQFPATVASLSGSLAGCFVLKKWMEYDADSTMIKHVSDSAALRAVANQQLAAEKLLQHRTSIENPRLYAQCQKYPILYELLDVHPRGSKRAARFLKRAEELEKSQKNL